MAQSNRSFGNTHQIRSLWILKPDVLLLATMSGSERIERLRHLAEEGNEVFLVSANVDRGRFRNLDPKLSIISIPSKQKSVYFTLLYGLALIFLSPFYILKHKPKVIVSDLITTPFLFLDVILTRILGVKMILDVRSTPVGDDTPAGRRNRRFFRASMWIAKSLFNGMTIVTSMMRDEICHTFSINPQWTSILSNGISEEFLVPCRNDKQRFIREELSLSNKFVVIYHGGFRLTGGLVESVKAIGFLKRKYPDIVLLLLGKGYKEVEDLLKKTIKENNLENNVIIHSPVEFQEVPNYVSMSDVGLVPLPNIETWRYQQPIKLLEYLSMNKTVIVTDSPSHRPIVGNGKNAIYIPVVTPTEIARAIEYAYCNRCRLKEWGSIGRDIIVKRYIWKKLNQELIAYFQDVIQSKNGRAATLR